MHHRIIKQAWLVSSSPYVKFLMWLSGSSNEDGLLIGINHMLCLDATGVQRREYFRFLARAKTEGLLEETDGKLWLKGQLLNTLPKNEGREITNISVDKTIKCTDLSLPFSEICTPLSLPNKYESSNVIELGKKEEKNTTDLSLLKTEICTPLTLPENKKSRRKHEGGDEHVRVWNTTCGEKGLPKVIRLSPARARLLSAISIEEFKSACDYLATDPFYGGKNNKGWYATFDWIINPNNLIKILERSSIKQPKPTNGDSARSRSDATWAKINQEVGPPTETDASWVTEVAQ